MTQPNDPAGGAETAPPIRSDETRLVWIDMEMTGLRPDIDRIIEVAAVVTDSDLNVLVESPSFAVPLVLALEQRPGPLQGRRRAF